MLAVRCALGDPAAEGVDLGGGEFLVGIRRGHHLVRVFGEDALEKGACGGSARFDCLGAILDGVSALGGIKTEVGLAFFGVESMTAKTVVGENGADFAIKVDWAIRVWRGLCADAERAESRKENQEGCKSE